MSFEKYKGNISLSTHHKLVPNEKTNTSEGNAEITHVILNFSAFKIPLKIVYALLHLDLLILQMAIPASLKEKEVKHN
jgi:hypothetical protein